MCKVRLYCLGKADAGFAPVQLPWQELSAASRAEKTVLLSAWMQAVASLISDHCLWLQPAGSRDIFLRSSEDAAICLPPAPKQDLLLLRLTDSSNENSPVFSDTRFGRSFSIGSKQGASGPSTLAHHVQVSQWRTVLKIVMHIVSVLPLLSCKASGKFSCARKPGSPIWPGRACQVSAATGQQGSWRPRRGLLSVIDLRYCKKAGMLNSAPCMEAKINKKICWICQASVCPPTQRWICEDCEVQCCARCFHPEVGLCTWITPWAAATPIALGWKPRRLSWKLA